MSVAALLRREGRGPHVADRPLLPRGHARVAQPPPEPPRRNVRKVAVAAGALFAATAVLGPSVVEDAASRSAPGQDRGIPLPLAGTPELPGGTGRDEPVFAAVQQLFAEGIPSEVDAAPLGDDTTQPAAVARNRALQRPLTPDRASTGPTGPTDEPAPGTVPPGGAGTPPGGTWSWTLPPGASPGGSAAPGVVLSPGGQAGNGPSADVPAGAAPPAGTGAAPAAATPPVHVPAAGADLPGVGPLRTPAVTVGPGAVVPPSARVAAAPGKVAVSTTPAEVRTPDVAASGARVGPVETSGAAVTTPDVGVSGARLALSADAPPEVGLPGVQISATEIDPPDIDLGPAEIDLPEVAVPAVEVPSVTLGDPDGEDSDDAEDADAEDADTDLGSAVTGTVGGVTSALLGGDRSDEDSTTGTDTGEETDDSSDGDGDRSDATASAEADDDGSERPGRHRRDDSDDAGSDSDSDSQSSSESESSGESSESTDEDSSADAGEGDAETESEAEDS